MTEEFNVVCDNEEKEEIDYLSLGKAMKKYAHQQGSRKRKLLRFFMYLELYILSMKLEQ